MARHLPEVAFQVWPDEVSDLEQVRYALVWKLMRGFCAGFRICGLFNRSERV